MPQVLILLLPSLLLFAIIAYFIWESLSLSTLVATEPQTQTRHHAAAGNGMMIPWPQMVWPKFQALVHISGLCMGSNGNLDHTVHNRARWSWHMDPDMASVSCLAWSTSLFWMISGHSAQNGSGGSMVPEHGQGLRIRSTPRIHLSFGGTVGTWVSI